MRGFPEVRCRVIGKSVLGRNLYELRFGSGTRSVHFNAAFHANEWITSLVLMEWLETILSRIGTDFPKAQLFQLSVVPMVNPDGVEMVALGRKERGNPYPVEEMNDGKPDYYSWKANARGVDLNKQFPAHWDEYKCKSNIKTPYYRDFPGEAPLTEPEAIAMKKLVESSDFHHIIALHTQGKEFYWGYKGFEPEEAEQYAAELKETSVYRAIRNVNSSAGFRDWFIYCYGKAGFTLELGKGINPLPLSQLGSIISDTFPILDRALFLGK
ncbi:M14 family metallocarboxypeptidase [Bacillus sp. 1P06AnD]|uniref:M14 family metallopeptidase n=1 Tax=Bacillus sp. 1P06AnD TaxID=3132208 RepID=UPI00399F48CF